VNDEGRRCVKRLTRSGTIRGALIRKIARQRRHR